MIEYRMNACSATLCAGSIAAAPPLPLAATVAAGCLYVSVADGTLYRLGRSDQSWERVGRGTPRVAHRAVADGQSILVMGGAHEGKDLDVIEAISVNQGR